MGFSLDNDDEVLYRQVNPGFYDNGEPSSQPFMPTTKDENQLSVDRSSLTNAKSSYELFIANGHKSAAVYGLTVGDFRKQDLPCFSDPLLANKGQLANPAHAYADYAAHGVQQQKKKAKRLKLLAIARTCLYRP